LYVDYINDSRVPISFTPDWLIEPPMSSPYMMKKENNAEIPFFVRIAYNY
jgi:hypothetical protein